MEKKLFRCAPLVGVGPWMFDLEDSWEEGGIESSEPV